jgi:polysaccharide pyruvyl transferase WcaK-like protein
MGKLKVVVSHSWSKNMGDLAILLTITRMLREISPGCQISALVSHPQITGKKCPGLDVELDRWVWPMPAKERPGVLDLAWYPVVFANNMASAVVFRLFKRRFFLFNRHLSSPLGRFFDCDVIISPGGDFMGPKYFFVTAFGELIMARILGKKSIICAQTIGPMEGFFNGLVVAPVLSLVDLIIVRDERTAHDLKGIGVKGAMTTSDLVFAYKCAPKKERANSVIMCPKRIRRGRERYMDNYRVLARRVIDELGYRITFLPTDEYDVKFQGEVASGVGRPGVEIIGEVGTPAEIADNISKSEFIVSTRMHAIILGTLSRTPFFAVGDSHKFSGVLGTLCEDCVLDIGSFDEAGIERIIRSIKDKEALKKSIIAKFPRVQERAQENAEIIRGKFLEWGFAD